MNINILLFMLFVFILPISFGNVAGIRSLTWFQAISPIILFYSLIFEKRKIFFVGKQKSNSFLFIWVSIYLFVYIFNYLRNPLIPSGLLGRPMEEGGFSIYLIIFISFGLFFYSSRFILQTNLNSEKILKKFEWFLFAIIFLGLSLFIPFVENIFLYLQNINYLQNEIEWKLGRFTNGGFRIGALSLITPMYLAIVVAYNREVTKSIVVKIFFAMIVLVISGGRIAFFSSLLLLTYKFLFDKRKIIIILPVILIMVSFNYLMQNQDFLGGGFMRIFNVSSEIAKVDLTREAMIDISIQKFIENPIFGIGLGSVNDISSPDTFEKYLFTHLRYGGHGSYISVVLLTGLSGLVPFIFIIFLSLKYSYQLTEKDWDFKELSNFIHLFIFYNLSRMAFEGRGPEPLLLTTIGLINGLYMKSISLKSND